MLKTSRQIPVSKSSGEKWKKLNSASLVFSDLAPRWEVDWIRLGRGGMPHQIEPNVYKLFGRRVNHKSNNQSIEKFINHLTRKPIVYQLFGGQFNHMLINCSIASLDLQPNKKGINLPVWLQVFWIFQIQIRSKHLLIRYQIKYLKGFQHL